ncbi:MAG: hypothetical protein IJB59_09865 [Oscillospiraceae bacterium]|nr:hypothetical protein [Oscillospiraceae bacterium]
MTKEDLFLAIGEVEESRLLRSEWVMQASSDVSRKEKPEMKKKRVCASRIVRNVLIAAVIVSMLGVTAYAVGGYIIFESPQEMIAAVFGDKTGYDHKDVTTVTDPEKPGSVYEEPAYDRVPADEEIVESEVAPLVSPVGQSISWNGYTLRVDANMYDQVTKCGVLTYALENPEGIGEYEVQNNGRVWFAEGEIVYFSQYGYSYIIQDQSNDKKLTATYYYQLRDRESTDLEIGFTQWATITHEEYEQKLADLKEQIRQEIPEEEAIALKKQQLGEYWGWYVETFTREEIIESGYTDMAHEKMEEIATCPDKITIPENALGEMTNITLADCDITISSIAMYIDITDMTNYPRESIGVVIIRFKDGTEYVVVDDRTENYMFAVGSSERNDTTYMFNRIIDVNEVASVILDGNIELTVD